MIKLEIFNKQNNRHSTHLLTNELTTLGKNPNADIHLNGEGVSGFHLAILHRKNKSKIFCLDSRTLLRQKKSGTKSDTKSEIDTLESELNSGTIFLLGDTELHIQFIQRAQLWKNLQSNPIKKIQKTSSLHFNRELKRPLLISSTIFICILLIQVVQLLLKDSKLETTEPVPHIASIPIEITDESPIQAPGSDSISPASNSNNASNDQSNIQKMLQSLIQNTSVEKTIQPKINNHSQQVQSAPTQQALKTLTNGSQNNIEIKNSIHATNKSFGSGSGTGLANGVGMSTGMGQGTGLGSSSGSGAGHIRYIEEETLVEGGLDKEIIAAIIHDHLSQIKYCYEKQLITHPNLYGKVVVKWIISPEGKVVEPIIKNSTLHSTQTEYCIINKISTWVFPKPKNGSQVTVTYPFLFKSAH